MSDSYVTVTDVPRSGSAGYADAVHDAMNGFESPILEEIAALRFGLDQAEFDRQPL